MSALGPLPCVESPGMASPRTSSASQVPVRYLLAALGLFLVWSNSFIAASYLLGSEARAAQLDWISLSVLRFVPIAPLCLLYCLLFRRRETMAILRNYPVRIAITGLLGAPGYNLALYYGQQHGVPPPVASLTTALLPLFVMLLAAVILGESLTGRKIAAFLIAFLGLALIALSKGNLRAIAGYGLVLGVTALAPLSWSIYSILSKPVMGLASPLVWTYLGIAIGSLPLYLLLPWHGGPQISGLAADGWLAVLYLSVLCTLAGYAVWTWLLRQLPATTVGFTVFFNPPLTTASKLVLSLALPTLFIFQLDPLEWVGGGLALLGLALAVWPSRRRSDCGSPPGG